MQQIDDEVLDQISRIKDNVRNSHDYFKPNYDRFNEFTSFVFNTSLTEDHKTLLMTLSKPTLEFNVLEAYISRLLGEFSKQEPSIEVSADNEVSVDPKIIKLVEQHIRHEFSDSNNEHVKWSIYKDLLAGGYSVGKVTTEYAHPMSFNQVLKFARAYDPTLCGFDPLARFSHKGDGSYCFELFPMTCDNFRKEYPEIDTDDFSFRRDFQGFNWSYLNDKTPIIILAEYYEKKKVKKRIVQLRDGQVVTEDKYKKMIKEWDSIEQPPAMIGEARTTEIETIVRYRLVENQIINYEETDFTFFPLVFFDGNSILVRTPKNGNIVQMTRPYVYHAKDTQRLKNFAGIALANEIENTVQHKFIVKKEALPKEAEWREAFKDVQKASTLIVNAFDELDPNKAIPDPIREVMRVPAPPEIMQGFSGVDGLFQMILGSYDASLGVNENQLSGVAIVEGATQSNAAAMPYIVGFLQGINRIAEIYINLFPKYYTTPRTIPILDEEGKRSYVEINGKESPKMFYDENALNVRVNAGVSFQVQKSKALQQIIALSGTSKIFDQFINTKGLPIIMDNLEIKGVEELKELSREWQKEMEMQKQQAMQAQQQAMQNNPAVMRAQNEQQKMQYDMQRDSAQHDLDIQELEFEKTKLMADILQEEKTSGVKMEEIQTRQDAILKDLAIKEMDMRHKHVKDILDMHHRVQNAHKDREERKENSKMNKRVQE